MQEDIIFRRRNRLKKHFVNVSNVLLYCYGYVSDAAKITFQVIDGFDWESKDTGESKGYVFPAVETLATIRRTSVRTIQRHILELIKAHLLTRIRQRNKPSILYIEEVSDGEVQKYFQFFDAKNKHIDLTQPENQYKRETTKMSFAYMKKNEGKEHEMNVNENFQFVQSRQRSRMQGLRDIMSQFAVKTPDGIKRVRHPKKPEATQRRDFLAEEIAISLGDQKSLGAFRKIAERVPEVVIREFLAQIKETWQEGKVKKSRGALFISMIQQFVATHQIDLGFQSTG